MLEDRQGAGVADSTGLTVGASAGELSRSALLRLSLVRFSASFLVILTTGILNRILIVDLGVAAFAVTVVLSFQHLTSPFALISGHLSDRRPIGRRRRVPYIRLWTLVSALLVPLMPILAQKMTGSAWWLVPGALVFGLFGFGLKAANLLVGALLVDRVPDPERRGQRFNLIWIMAIAGFIVAGFSFTWLLPSFDAAQPGELGRLQTLCTGTSVLVVALTWLGTWRVEPEHAIDALPEAAPGRAARPGLLVAIRQVIAAPRARLLFAFLFLADFSFFVQEFILEAFGGDVFALPVSVTTSFNVTFGLGMVIAMLGAGSLGVLLGRFPTRKVLIGSCALGAFSFGVLAFSAVADASTALLTAVFVLGVAKGLYNVGLAHLFMGLATADTAGVLMGAWGAFGGFAVALGGLSGGLLVEVAQSLVGDLGLSYGLVFGVEVLGMIAAMVLIVRDRSQR